MQKQRRSSQETIVQPWGSVLVLSQVVYTTISLSSSAGTKAPTWVEGGNFRLSPRFLKYCPITNQSEESLHTVEDNEDSDPLPK